MHPAREESDKLGIFGNRTSGDGTNKTYEKMNKYTS